MTAGIIISSVFLFLSVLCTVLCFTVLRKKNYSVFIGASAGVYASACLMILLFSIFKKDLPILFFILADGLVTGVFVMTSLMMLVLLTKTTPASGAGEKEEVKEEET